MSVSRSHGKVLSDIADVSTDVTIVKGYHSVPSVNSVISSFIRDVVGNKGDFVQVPYVLGQDSIMAHNNTAYYHVHGKPLVYPDLADNVVLTSGAGAWGTGGAKTEVIPAGALSEAAFDLHWINISAISANQELQIDFYAGGAGSEEWIGSTRPFRNAVTSSEGARRIQIKQQPAGTRISCRLSSSGAAVVTCAVSFEGHYYKGY